MASEPPTLRISCLRCQGDGWVCSDHRDRPWPHRDPHALDRQCGERAGGRRETTENTFRSRRWVAPVTMRTENGECNGARRQKTAPNFPPDSAMGPARLNVGVRKTYDFEYNATEPVSIVSKCGPVRTARSRPSSAHHIRYVHQGCSPAKRSFGTGSAIFAHSTCAGENTYRCPERLTACRRSVPPMS
jgi:hypothetical protein